MNELDKLLQIKEEERQFKKNTLLLLGATGVSIAGAVVVDAPSFGLFSALSFVVCVGNAIAWDDAASYYDSLENQEVYKFSQSLDTWQAE